MKVGIVALTGGARELAAGLAASLTDATFLAKAEGETIADVLRATWPRYDGFICIMAAGIVVRAIAPLLQDKFSDPCIVIVDEKGRYAISLLSGHIGGGNELAREVARLTGGTAVITTASDTLELVALDLWIMRQQLALPDRRTLTRLAAQLVNRGRLLLYSEVPVQSLPAGLQEVEDIHRADIIVSHLTKWYGEKIPAPDCAVLSPVNLVVGVGCNRGTPRGEFEDALNELFEDLHLSRSSIRNLASIDKKNDEQGLLQFAADNGWRIDFFDSCSLNKLTNLEISFAALRAVGAIGVAEPSALLSGQSNQLLSRKRKWKNITMAVAEAPFTLSAQVQARLNR